MGDYRLLDDQTDDSAGVLRTADGAMLEPNVRNTDWQVYLAWRAVPNTPDPATATTIGLLRKRRKAAFDVAAGRELAKELRGQHLPAHLVGMCHAVLLEELYRYEGDGSPSAADYPLLDALVGEEGATLADVAAAVRTWWDTHKDRVADVFAELWEVHKDVNAAANKAAVDAISPTWPGGDGGE